LARVGLDEEAVPVAAALVAALDAEAAGRSSYGDS